MQPVLSAHNQIARWETTIMSPRLPVSNALQITIVKAIHRHLCHAVCIQKAAVLVHLPLWHVQPAQQAFEPLVPGEPVSLVPEATLAHPLPLQLVFVQLLPTHPLETIHALSVRQVQHVPQLEGPLSRPV